MDIMRDDLLAADLPQPHHPLRIIIRWFTSIFQTGSTNCLRHALRAPTTLKAMARTSRPQPRFRASRVGSSRATTRARTDHLASIPRA